MRLFASFAALALSVATATAAHATPLVFTAGTYNFSATAPSGTTGQASESFTGTININTGGLVTAVNLTFADLAKPSESMTFKTSTVNTGVSGPADYFAVYSSTSGASGQFEVFYTATAPGTFSVCTSAAVTSSCPSYDESYLQIYNGYVPSPIGPSGPASAYLSNASITMAPAPTPEPSSLVLLGTGALGLFGAARRRLLKA